MCFCQFCRSRSPCPQRRVLLFTYRLLEHLEKHEPAGRAVGSLLPPDPLPIQNRLFSHSVADRVGSGIWHVLKRPGGYSISLADWEAAPLDGLVLEFEERQMAAFRDALGDARWELSGTFVGKLPDREVRMTIQRQEGKLVAT